MGRNQRQARRTVSGNTRRGGGGVQDTTGTGIALDAPPGAKQGCVCGDRLTYASVLLGFLVVKGLQLLLSLLVLLETIGLGVGVVWVGLGVIGGHRTGVDHATVP